MYSESHAQWGGNARSRQITVLGHDVVAGLGVRPGQAKIEAIIAMDLSGKVDALATFIGATGWVAKFVPEYAALVAPLREVTKKYKSESKICIKHEWQGGDNQCSSNEGFQCTG